MGLERVGMFHKDTDVTYPSCNLAYKKSVFKDINGFDPWFKEAEEIDLNFRAVDAGYKLIYNDKAIVYHRLRESVHGFFKQSFWYGFGRKELTQKHGTLWSKYNILEMVQMSAKESVWKLVRLGIAAAGYMFCKVFSRKGKEMEMKEKLRQSKLSDR
jgi:GT2 family glycosyltransferase